MARILIRQAHGGQTRIISDPALPYFLNQGWVVLDDYDDAEDIPPVYLSRAEGDLRWASIADLGDPASAEVVVISEAVADVLVDPATGPGADLRAASGTYSGERTWSAPQSFADDIWITGGTTDWIIRGSGDNIEIRKDGATDWFLRIDADDILRVHGAIVTQGYSGSQVDGVRIPFNNAVVMDGSTLTAANPGDKVGMQNSVTFRGGFSNEAGYGVANPAWLFGANDFIIAGRDSTAGDLSGITTMYGRLTEAHVVSTDASLTTLHGLMVETSSNSPVTSVVGLRVVGHRHGATGSAGVVAAATGLEITSPTQGTTKYALATTGDARSYFSGSVDVGFGAGTAQLVHVYDGEFRGKLATIGGSAVGTRGGANTPSDAMLTVKSRADADVVAWLHGRGAQSGDILRMGRDSTVGTRFDMRGRFIQANTVAPLDADLANGDLAQYVDSTSGAMKLMLKGRDAGGTIRTGSVALA